MYYLDLYWEFIKIRIKTAVEYRGENFHRRNVICLYLHSLRCLVLQIILDFPTRFSVLGGEKRVGSLIMIL